MADSTPWQSMRKQESTHTALMVAGFALVVSGGAIYSVINETAIDPLTLLAAPALLWCVAALFLLTAWLQVQQLHTLATQAKRTTGQVIGLTKAKGKHQKRYHILYEFSVDKKMMQGKTMALAQRFIPQHIGPGSQIAVLYHPGDPTQYCWEGEL